MHPISRQWINCVWFGLSQVAVQCALFAGLGSTTNLLLGPVLRKTLRKSTSGCAYMHRNHAKRRNGFTRFTAGSPHLLKASYLRGCGVKSATASLLTPEDRMAIRSTHTEGWHLRSANSWCVLATAFAKNQWRSPDSALGHICRPHNMYCWNLATLGMYKSTPNWGSSIDSYWLESEVDAVCSVVYNASKAAWSKCGFSVFTCWVGNLAKSQQSRKSTASIQRSVSIPRFTELLTAMACITTKMHLFMAMAAALPSKWPRLDLHFSIFHVAKKMQQTFSWSVIMGSINVFQVVLQ